MISSNVTSAYRALLVNRAHLNFWYVVYTNALFPLTPALSPGEREFTCASLSTAKSSRVVGKLARILPLPEGEGRGEGEQRERTD
jgi:hypothetical protein